MKHLVLIAFTFSTFSAFASTPAEIYKTGLRLIQKYQDDGQMDYLLNPIICEGTTSGKITLIFSDDFRHRESAYLIDGDLVMKAKTSKLGLLRGDSLVQGEVNVQEVIYKNEKMTCASSTLVLESVPGAR